MTGTTDTIRRAWMERRNAEAQNPARVAFATSLMSELANQVKEAGAEAAETESLTEEDRVRLRARFAELEPVFVAAALEYALRGHSIREAAFFGGYAPLIFRAQNWRIPGEKGQRKKKKKKENPTE